MRGRVAVVALAVLALALPASASGQGAIAFTSLRCDQGGVPWQGSRGPFCTRGIFVVNDDGSGLKRLTTGAAPGEEHRSGDFSPSWSPAADRIVFSRQTSEGHGYSRLYTMAANGSDQRRVIDPPTSAFLDESASVWSPTGPLIAFQVQLRESPFVPAVYVVRPDGGGLRRVSPPGWSARSPAFTRDGLRVVFFGSRVTERKGAPPQHEDHGVWMTDILGSEPVRVTAGDLPIAANGLSFSPSGLHIAVTVGVGPEPQLYAMRSDGSSMRKIENAIGVEPTWSGAGNALFYISGDHALSTVVTRLDLRSGAKPVALTNTGGGDLSPDWSALGRATTILPSLDELPPITIIGDQVELPTLPPAGPPPSGRRIASAQAAVPWSRIPYLAMDASGIRRVEAAVGLRVKGGCRFLTSSRRLGPRRRCSQPAYVKVAAGTGWKKQTAKLPRGKYEVRFKTTDRRGNVTKRPKRRVVTLR